MTTQELQQAINEDRAVILPVPIGTPVVKLTVCQHDGPVYSPVFFDWNCVNAWGTSIFPTQNAAKEYAREIYGDRWKI